MNKEEFYNMLFLEIISFILDIIKDMVAAMPLGFSVAIATPFLCGFLIFLLYNKILN